MTIPSPTSDLKTISTCEHMTLIFPWKYAKARCTWPQGTSSIQGATLPVCTISELLLGRTSCWELPGIPNSSPTEPNKRHRPHHKHIITHTQTLTSLRLFAPTCSFLDLKNVELVIFFYSFFTFLTPHIPLLVFLSCLQMFLCTCHADSDRGPSSHAHSINLLKTDTKMSSFLKCSPHCNNQ